MMDSNLMTAKRREEKPRIHARPRTTNTTNDFVPAGLKRKLEIVPWDDDIFKSS